MPRAAQADRQQAVLNILQDLHRTKDKGLKELFWTELNYSQENKPLSPRQWPDSARQVLAEDPILFASGGEGNAFHIVYCRLASAELSRGLQRPVVNQLLRDHPYALFVFSNKNQSAWHFLNVKYDEKAENRRLFRRITVRPGAGLRTATERVQLLDLAGIHPELFGITPLAIQQRCDVAFDVEAVTKDFFHEIANWYFWALKNVRFPKDAPKEADGHDHISVIRLITRLIFCWFVKEKGLIPDTLFDERKLAHTLTGFEPAKTSDKESVFYRAILQNLFFATLNTEMDKRGWTKEEQNFMAHSLYRHRELFSEPKSALDLFKEIPFLNGGLFECLDKDLGENAKPRHVRIDGFSRREDSQPIVPDFLFFGGEHEVDLSADYGDKKFRRVPVRGLIHIFNRYHFTIEENTPIEQEVALDPELSGKVFENLLAAYNPETGATARKQTGSFYTPREIVNYMVDEALIACLKTKLEAALPSAKDVEARLRHLFAYNDEPHEFTPPEVDALIAAIDGLKSLDLAVGSGAFPMGILHKLVFILGKLDPRNEKWKERQIARVRDTMANAEKIEDATARERAVRELEQQIAGIVEAFEHNELDYGRKLYLIENCIYGVDIQPIAVQIAKMRFFISLIVDQKIDDTLPNRGVRPLPNLETKFVAANTLIGVNRPGQQLLRNREIDDKEAELRGVRERYFVARTPKQKAKCRDDDARLRAEIAELLKGDGWDTATARKLAAWDPYDQNASANFFDPEWMFGILEGFDVLVANPPYVDSENMTRNQPEMRRLYTLAFKAAKGNWDLFILFVEKGYDLLATNGMISYIVPNKLLGAPYSQSVRKLMSQNCVHEMRDYSRVRVFKDADVYPVVFVAEKCQPCRSVTMSVMSDLDTVQSTNSILQNIFYRDISWDRYFTGDAALQIDAKCLGFRPLATYYPDISGEATVSEAYEFKEVVRDMDGHSTKSAKRLINTGTIDRYCSLWGIYATRYLKGSYQRPIVHEDDIRGISSNRLSQARSKKIIIGGMNTELECFLDDGDYLAGKSTVVILEGRKLDLKYALGILNSRLISYWYRNHFKSMSLAGGYLRIGQNEIRTIPVPEPNNDQSKSIVDLVDQVLSKKQKNSDADTSALERDIDEQVYALYGLTPEEIKIVEGAK